MTPWGCEGRDRNVVREAATEDESSTIVWSDKSLSGSRRLFMGRRLQDTAQVDWLVTLEVMDKGGNELDRKANADKLLSNLGGDSNYTTANDKAGVPISILVRGLTLTEIMDKVKGVPGITYVEQDFPAVLVPDTSRESVFGEINTDGPSGRLLGDKILKHYTLAHKERRLKECSDKEQSFPDWGLDRVDDYSQADHCFGDHAHTLGYGEGVGIYVIDTGISYDHKDFGGRAVPALSYKQGYQEVCDSTDKTCAFDDDGHGTHCAALAAGDKYGVAKKANIYGIRVMDAAGAISMNWVVQSIDWVIESKPQPAVITMSLQALSNYLPCLEAITRATDAGITVTVAAGNAGLSDHPDACDYSPAFVPTAITVGSVDEGDLRSAFSNYGSCIDIFAPGRNIRSASNEDVDGFKVMSGTSQAAPLVAGSAALLLGSDPTLNVRGVTDLLVEGATKDLIQDEKEGSPDKILFVGIGIEKLGTNESLFTPLDGGTNRACRGRNENDGNTISAMWLEYFGSSYYDIQYGVEKREICERLCEQNAGCIGFEYKFHATWLGLSERGRCELWNRQIAATAEHEGFECYMRNR
jgi:subtilisin family serine protease